MVTGFVDAPNRIAAFTPSLRGVVAEGMVIREKVGVPVYRHNSKGE